MESLKKGWFSELSELWPGTCFSLEVEKVLHKEKSEFQDIKILQTKSHGKVLVLDDIIQCTEADEFTYQEMISFLPLCSHPKPEKVLIVGGGDGGVAREVAKHPDVMEITQVEIDERVIELSKQYLPFMGCGFSHPKLNLVVGDGFKFMTQHKQQFDVIITDSSDPIGPAVSLFQQSYFSLMKDALRPGGIICSQAGTVWFNIEWAAKVVKHCKGLFKTYAYGFASVPTYPSGQIGFALASLNEETNFREPVRTFTEKEMDEMRLRYYSPAVHRAAFALPRFAEKALYGTRDTNENIRL